MGSYGGPAEERNPEATVYVGELAPEVTEGLLWELMLQAGPVVGVNIPRDKVSSAHGGFGFVEFAGPRDAEYAIRVMGGGAVKLFGRSLRLDWSNARRKAGGGGDVGATLFVGNLDPGVDEALLAATFGAFGALVAPPRVMRDDSGASKGYAFLGYDSFAASDAAIEAMNGQYLANRPVSVSYAYRRDAKGERHGGESERALAQRKSQQQQAMMMQQQQQQQHTPMPFVPILTPPPGVFVQQAPPAAAAVLPQQQ